MTIIPDNAKKNSKKSTFFKTLKRLRYINPEHFLWVFLAVFKTLLRIIGNKAKNP